MRKNLPNIVVSLALILAGVVFLAQNLGYVQVNSSMIWTSFFGGMSLLFFVSYFVSGLRSWGLLFPAMILGALALTIGLTAAGINSAALGTPILAAVALPFFGAFALDRKKNWWALIPGTIVGVISLIPLIQNRAAGEVIGSMVLFSVAMPFLVTFLVDTSKRWALIPALVLGFVGLIPLVTLIANSRLIPVLVMLVFAVPFILVYLAERKAWWALIPAGVFGGIGAGILVGTFFSEPSAGIATAGVMFLGWGATFLVLWLLRQTHPTVWAIYPAIACASIALLSFAFAPALRFVWPIVLIGAGAYVVLKGLRPKKSV